MNTINEIELYKEHFKSGLLGLIKNKEFEKALSLMEEYETSIKNDVDILNMKSIVLIEQNQLETAEQLLWRCIELGDQNGDTLFNLAYLYERKGETATAGNLYRTLYSQSKDEQEKKEIESILFKLGCNISEKKMRFVLLSSCPWGKMLQRPHHMARALMRQGFNVDYIQPPVVVRDDVEEANVSTNDLLVISRENLRKHGLVNIYTPILYFKQDIFQLGNYREILQEILDTSSNEEIVFLCYFPSQITTINKLSGNFKVIYECVDDHGDIEHSFWSSKIDRHYETELVERANLITTTSSALYLSKSLHNDRVILSKNAVNIDDFSHVDMNVIPDDIKNIPHPRVCYVGAVESWFDEDLFYHLVRSNRNKSFVVIGPVKEGMLAEKEENLFVLGIKEHSQLKNYLQNMRVGIIPFKDDLDLIVNCDPIKMYEYVLSGLPVVATNMPELAYNIDFIRISDNLDSFNGHLNELIDRKISNAEIGQFIKENTWDTRARHLITEITTQNQLQNREKVRSELRENWKEVLLKQESPIIEALIALSYGTEDSRQFYELIQKAYRKSKLPFIFKNYVFASVLTNNLFSPEDVQFDENINQIDKEEFLFLHYNGLEEFLRIWHLTISAQYQSLIYYIKALKNIDSYDYGIGNYYVSIGRVEEATSIFLELVQRNKVFQESPLIRQILGENMVELRTNET
ncbi:glycosyltransferase [Brevibacillus brevis]|uniref:Glycosyltransferase n=1 Tax=Brevibacillus brevis TaxID=1393 RepID=A0ABY9T4M6_BREBE|nr:glycosyltransferase [Brevibacillus brevis]WNC14459.1 glycosyltransferase [Brevibacillus brevis]